MTYQTDPRVDDYIIALPKWQQAICRRARDLAHAADPAITETIKRKSLPYFVLEGNVIALVAAKNWVTILIYDTRFDDPQQIVTGGHDNKTGRYMQIQEG